jgi:hypothetical protein
MATEFQAIGNYQMGVGFDAEAKRALDGFAPAASMQSRDLAHQRRVTEAARLYAAVLSGREDPVMFREAMSPRHPAIIQYLAETYPGIYGRSGNIGLREAMSTTDYKALFLDVLDRKYYGTWAGFPIATEPLCRVSTLNDFRPVDRYLADGAVSAFKPVAVSSPAPESAVTGPVPQGGSVLATADTAALQYQPKAYQAEMSTNWQARVNDDLGMLNDNINRLVLSGNRGICRFITGLFFDANGPNASLYTSGFGNQIITANAASVNNPPLGVQGLMDGFKILAGMLDSNGEPILINGKVTVVYGPAYAATAQNLQNMLTNQISVEGGLGGSGTFPSQYVQTNNWVVQGMNWIMDPYIPLIATSKKLSWLMVCDPNSQNRPAVEIGYLKGFRTPQMYRRLPTMQRVGGGVEDVMGNYDTMRDDVKIIGVFGGRGIDGRTTVGSNGGGT